MDKGVFMLRNSNVTDQTNAVYEGMEDMKRRFFRKMFVLGLFVLFTVSCSIPPLVEYTVVPADELEFPPASSNPFASAAIIVDERASNLARVLHARLEPLGLKNYEIKWENNEIRIIALAGKSEQELIEKLLTQQGHLTFCEVHPENESLCRKAMGLSTPPLGFRMSEIQGDLFYFPVDPDLISAEVRVVSVPDEAAPPSGYRFCLEKTVSPQGSENEAYRLCCISQHVGLDGSSIASAKARPSFNDEGRWEVDVMFNSRGGRAFSDLTKRCIGKKLAILLDNVVISAPVVQQEIYSPSCQITGNFTKVEAETLTFSLNSGSLPCAGKIVQKRLLSAGRQ